ncbi:hypothetical protein KY285_022814 [Solanum tuberosum]|nr:hypothetical protein KY285_022814 [Solanum tuberosum]
MGQVELSCSRGTLDINHVVSFYRLSLATIMMKNNGRDPVKLTLAILSHLMSKTRGGTGIQGLQSCTYCRHPLLSSVFDILSPGEAKKTEEPGIFSFGWASEKKRGIWSTQNVFITVLKHKLHVLRLAEEHKVVCNLTSPTQGLTSLTDRCQII